MWGRDRAGSMGEGEVRRRGRRLRAAPHPRHPRAPLHYTLIRTTVSRQRPPACPRREYPPSMALSLDQTCTRSLHRTSLTSLTLILNFYYYFYRRLPHGRHRFCNHASFGLNCCMELLRVQCGKTLCLSEHSHKSLKNRSMILN